jgi:hypothetical protein
MNYINIDVPVKPYVKAYMENNFGAPCEMDRSNKYGRIMFLLLSDGSRERDNKYRQYPEKLSMKLSSTFWHRRGSGLTRTNVIYFNQIIEDDIKLKLRTFVYALTCQEKPIKRAEAIRRFLNIYGFSPDVFPFDTAKKDIDRSFRHLKYSESD